MRNILALTLTMAFVPAVSFAALQANEHQHQHAAPKTINPCQTKEGKPCSPSTKAYMKSARTMHKGMDIKYSGNPDVDFARGMVPHHQAAVDMVKVVLQYGKDPEIRKLAEWIKTSQKLEIDQMKGWLSTVGDGAWRDPKDPSIAAYKAAAEKMHAAMHIRYTGKPDVDFARGMIPHHEGAIAMADIVIKHGKDPVLLEIARNIQSSQQQEIARMQDWLKANDKK